MLCSGARRAYDGDTIPARCPGRTGQDRTRRTDDPGLAEAHADLLAAHRIPFPLRRPGRDLRRGGQPEADRAVDEEFRRVPGARRPARGGQHRGPVAPGPPAGRPAPRDRPFRVHHPAQPGPAPGRIHPAAARRLPGAALGGGGGPGRGPAALHRGADRPGHHRVQAHGRQSPVRRFRHQLRAPLPADPAPGPVPGAPPRGDRRRPRLSGPEADRGPGVPRQLGGGAHPHPGTGFPGRPIPLGRQAPGPMAGGVPARELPGEPGQPGR